MPKEGEGESKPGIDLAPLTGLIGPLAILLLVFGYIGLGELGIGEIGRIAKEMETKPANTEPANTPVPESNAPQLSSGNLNTGLPSWIFEDKVFGYAALCATINTPDHGYPEHFKSEEPIVSTVHQILRELGDRVYSDEVIFRLGEHVEVRKVKNIGKYANNWDVCGVKK